jgi:prevent-host-death family protein
MTWQVADAKNKLSEVITKALNDGPQRIRRRGETVVVISESEYERLTGKRKSFKEFLLSAPDFTGVDLTRDRTPMRDIDL